jgi:hypothetical protein
MADQTFREAAMNDFNRLFYFAGRNRQRVLLTALAYRRPLSDLPAIPQVIGVETQLELEQVIDNLNATCASLGYSPDDFVRYESGRLRPGYLTEVAFPSH